MCCNRRAHLLINGCLVQHGAVVITPRASVSVCTQVRKEARKATVYLDKWTALPGHFCLFFFPACASPKHNLLSLYQLEHLHITAAVAFIPDPYLPQCEIWTRLQTSYISLPAPLTSQFHSIDRHQTQHCITLYNWMSVNHLHPIASPASEAFMK